MKQAQTQLKFSTQGRGFCEITRDVGCFVDESRIQCGLAILHLHHTSASLLIQENADPDVRSDLERFFSQLVPDGYSLFDHTMEGPDDMPAHVRTALTQVNMCIPISNGHLTLGTWQGIYLWEHRHQPHTRTITLHLTGE